MANTKVIENTAKLDQKQLVSIVDDFQRYCQGQRASFAHHWYDNNFFDDGYHFRYISRTTGRLIDLSEKEKLYVPRRAIPKASRQIRGMANLVLGSDYVPVVMPEKVNAYAFPARAQDPAYKAAYDKSKQDAKRQGHWLEEEWKNQDLEIKLIYMVLNTLKHGVSYLQVWPDVVEEKINTQPYDAFDIYLAGNNLEIDQSPMVMKAIPQTIMEIKANENFDENQLKLISPDNRYASDEVKEAYLSSKYGREGKASDVSATLLLKETFIKEYLNDDNMERIRQQKNGGDILKEKKKGDIVFRQFFSAGGVWLRDEYLSIPSYPFVDFRWEPGPIYQTAPIEKFMHANKSLDTAVSRIERWLHTMNVGIWTKRKGENFKLTNQAGGIVAEYETTPPGQVPLPGLPSTVFNFVNFLVGLIEEQGTTTSSLGKLPKGVKAWGAIESLKASEFSNLYIPIKQLKKTIQKISEKMFDIADRQYVHPQSVMRMEKGNPDYFDVMGQTGIDKRKEMGDEIAEDIVPIKKTARVDVQVESGMGYTDEGKKGRMMELATWIQGLAQTGMITPDIMKQVIEKLFEVYKFGPTSEMMDALEGMKSGQMEPQAIEQMKVAFMEVFKDLQAAGVLGNNQQPQQGPAIPEREVEKTETTEETPEGSKKKTEVRVKTKEGGNAT